MIRFEPPCTARERRGTRVRVRVRDAFLHTDTLTQEHPVGLRRRFARALALGVEETAPRAMLHVGRPLAYEDAVGARRCPRDRATCTVFDIRRTPLARLFARR